MGIDISVVIPTCGRQAMLKNCLDSLSVQDYPISNIEIIIIDDRNDPSTKDLVNSLKVHHYQLKYFGQDHKGPAAARNLGARSSSASVVAFVDDDCVVDKNWARLMLESHKSNPQIVCVGGLTLIATQKTSVLVSQFLSTCSIVSWVGGKQEVIFFPTCNVSFKQHIFDKYQFDEAFPLPGGEDLEFFWRLFKDGNRFIWDKKIKVIHYRNDSFLSFMKQAYIYGRGNFLAQHIHKDHPLLHELKTGKKSFWKAIFTNTLKIFRFSHLLGKRLINEDKIKNNYKKLSVYSYFVFHKIFYILGNIFEYFRVYRNKNYIRSKILNIPRLLILDITHRCNLECRICDIWQTGKNESDLDIFYVKKVLSEASALGIPEIALSGGESLLRRDIFDILDYAKKLKIKNMSVLTNGILLKGYLERLKPYLFDNTISLFISLDSLKADLHNYIRNSDLAWHNTIEALNSLSALKKEYPQLNFYIISIILNQNIEELPDLVKFAKDLGANSLQFQALLPNNLRMEERKKSGFWVSEDRLATLDSIIDEIIELKKLYTDLILNSVPNLSLIKKYYRAEITFSDVECQSADKTVLMSNEGKFTTCFTAFGDSKKQSLSEVLQSKEIENARMIVKKCSWPCLLPCFCDR